MKNTFSALLISASLAIGVAGVAAPAQAAPPEEAAARQAAAREAAARHAAAREAAAKEEKSVAKEESAKVAASVMCNVSNVSFGGTAATACKGPFEGNDTGAQGTLLDDLDNGLFASSVGSNVEWTLYGKSDESNLFIQPDNSNSGKWSLNKAPSSGTFVISLKASNAYSAYLFKDIDFSKPGGLQGIFNTIGVALNGSGDAGADLSHASLFVPKVLSGPSTKVPEPSALIGLGLVLGGMVVARRKSRTANF